MSNQNVPWVASSALTEYYELVRAQSRLNAACDAAQEMATRGLAAIKLQGMMCTLLHLRDGIRPILNEYLPDLRLMNLIQTNKKGEDEPTPRGLKLLAEWEVSNEPR